MHMIIKSVAVIAGIISGIYLIGSLKPTDDDIAEQGYSDYDMPTPNHINKFAISINTIIVIISIIALIYYK